ncbi:hypothetical protein LINPERPRIM_LOCUS8944 [Linum perenne]
MTMTDTETKTGKKTMSSMKTSTENLHRVVELNRRSCRDYSVGCRRRECHFEFTMCSLRGTRGLRITYSRQRRHCLRTAPLCRRFSWSPELSIRGCNRCRYSILLISRSMLVLRSSLGRATSS